MKRNLLADCAVALAGCAAVGSVVAIVLGGCGIEHAKRTASPRPVIHHITPATFKHIQKGEPIQVVRAYIPWVPSPVKSNQAQSFMPGTDSRHYIIHWKCGDNTTPYYSNSEWYGCGDAGWVVDSTSSY